MTKYRTMQNYLGVPTKITCECNRPSISVPYAWIGFKLEVKICNSDYTDFESQIRNTRGKK